MSTAKRKIVIKADDKPKTHPKSFTIVKSTMTVMTIDIGLRNYAICVERFDKTAVEKCQNIEEVEKHGEILFLDIFTLPGKELSRVRDIDTHRALVELLRSLKDVFNEVNVVVIEQQLKQNPIAQKLEQATYSIILCLYPHIKPLEYCASIKTKAYNKRFKVKKDRKNWAIDNGTRILESRGDNINLNILKSTKKKDDMGDVISMVQAFKWWTINQRRL